MACVVSVVAAAVGSASPDTTEKRPFGGSRVYAFPLGNGGINVNALQSDSTIAIRSDELRNEFVITDLAGARIDQRYPEYAPLCREVSETRVRCAVQEPGGIRVALGNGNDYLRVEAPFNAPIVVIGDHGELGQPGDDVVEISNPPDAPTSRIQGNPGNDILLAGPSDDRLFGGPGDDVVRGRLGNDLVDGMGGGDRLMGGGDDDSIDAEKNDEDRSIDCGSGQDSAMTDLRLDPPPVRCEDVIGDETEP